MCLPGWGPDRELPYRVEDAQPDRNVGTLAVLHQLFDSSGAFWLAARQMSISGIKPKRYLGNVYLRLMPGTCFLGSLRNPQSATILRC